MAILELQENGRIQLLYNKWWRNVGTCNLDDKKDSKANSLGIANVGGIFVVLFVGLALAIVTAVVEFVWNSRKNAAVEKVSDCILTPPVNGPGGAVTTVAVRWTPCGNGIFYLVS